MAPKNTVPLRLCQSPPFAAYNAMAPAINDSSPATIWIHFIAVPHGLPTISLGRRAAAGKGACDGPRCAGHELHVDAMECVGIASARAPATTVRGEPVESHASARR